MSMSAWVIISWVAVILLTAINIFVFIKLKGASEQMMKMAFPGAKNMNEALAQMQTMMGQMKRGKGKGRGSFPGMPPGARMRGRTGKGNQDQLKAAMDMLQGVNKKKK